MNAYEMDWYNVDFDNTWNRSQCMLDGYDFETLFTELRCNIPTHELSRETIRQQFEETLSLNVDTAREIFRANLDNILAHELKTREDL